ncbi:hypothetical protein NQ315_003241 [Exocentrus adspersus]|uniref:Tyr recombinase domain-containing protein n=1 Tax=Exocentrus adspersus TaxID=1586481 RepID=A0AAV8VML4_9CUCU|nr:hypothetical protein NQ315_003241 [Exocentrus adspersus]
MKKLKMKAVCFTLKLLLQKLKFRGNFSLHLEVSKVSTWLKLCVDTSHYVNQILAMTDFLQGVCIRQPVGINTFGNMPKNIASFLNLPYPEQYTGHCFRRSSTSILADSGADLLTIKRHGGWKSNTVAEGYIDTSKGNKKKIAAKILGEETPSASNSGDSSFNIEKNTESVISGTGINFTFNIYNKIASVLKRNAMCVSFLYSFVTGFYICNIPPGYDDVNKISCVLIPIKVNSGSKFSKSHSGSSVKNLESQFNNLSF